MPSLVNLVGRAFGRLTVIARSGKRGRKVTWVCECRCGSQVIATGSSLRAGRIKSCGCLRRETAAATAKATFQRRFPDLPPIEIRKKNRHRRNLIGVWRRRFGIDMEGWKSILKSQAGVCPGCLTDISDPSLSHLDHDHGTGKVRGILCNRCNLFLGKMHDSNLNIERCAAYLEEKIVTISPSV